MWLLTSELNNRHIELCDRVKKIHLGEVVPKLMEYSSIIQA